MVKSQLRYFLDDTQKAQLVEILAEKAKKENQKPQESREYITTLLTNIIVWSSANMERIKQRGQCQMINGSTIELSQKELDGIAEPASNSEWVPKNPDAKLQIFTLAGESFLRGLKDCTKLQNAIHKKVGGDGKLNSCVEEFVNNAVVDTIIADYQAIRKKELEAELANSLKEEEEKPAAETADKAPEASPSSTT